MKRCVGCPRLYAHLTVSHERGVCIFINDRIGHGISIIRHILEGRHETRELTPITVEQGRMDVARNSETTRYSDCTCRIRTRHSRIRDREAIHLSIFKVYVRRVNISRNTHSTRNLERTTRFRRGCRTIGHLRDTIKFGRRTEQGPRNTHTTGHYECTTRLSRSCRRVLNSRTIECCIFKVDICGVDVSTHTQTTDYGNCTRRLIRSSSSVCHHRRFRACDSDVRVSVYIKRVRGSGRENTDTFVHRIYMERICVYRKGILNLKVTENFNRD